LELLPGYIKKSKDSGYNDKRVNGKVIGLLPEK
jgi:hypothetical protein